MSVAPVLVADIGGTNARFGIARASDGGHKLEGIRNFRAENFSSIGEAARAYLSEARANVTEACFAVAGPTGAGDIIFTNSPWRFNAADLKILLGLDRLKVVNDFYALAAGVSKLDETAFHLVKEGLGSPSAPRLVVGPGTGFGQALILPLDGVPHIIATEGGHVGFAPGTPLEIEILKQLEAIHHRVPVERLLSGPGLRNIYLALCDIAGRRSSLSTPEEITVAAVSSSDEQARQTVEIFCNVLGSVAGDAVLASGAQGGVFLGGGILMRIRDIFMNSGFVTRFLDKERMQNFVAIAPIRMITVDNVALLGAASVNGRR